jgi:hypothetical protein
MWQLPGGQYDSFGLGDGCTGSQCRSLNWIDEFTGSCIVLLVDMMVRHAHNIFFLSHGMSPQAHKMDFSADIMAPSAPRIIRPLHRMGPHGRMMAGRIHRMVITLTGCFDRVPASFVRLPGWLLRVTRWLLRLTEWFRKVTEWFVRLPAQFLLLTGWFFLSPCWFQEAVVVTHGPVRVHHLRIVIESFARKLQSRNNIDFLGQSCRVIPGRMSLRYLPNSVNHFHS